MIRGEFTIDSKLERLPYMHWVTVLALFFALAAIWGSTLNSSSLFITPIQESLNATRPEMVMGMTVKGLGNIVGAFLCAYLLRRMPVIKLVRIAGLLLVASIFALVYVQSIAQYYLVLTIQSALTSIGGYIPMSIIIHNWFEKYTSLAIGMAFMGSGFGGMIYNYLGGIWIPSLGWRKTLVFFGILTLAVEIITLFFITRATPYNLNMRPFGAPESWEDEEEEEVFTGMEIKEAFISPRFWIFLLAIFLVTMTTNGLFNNLSPHLIDSGYSLTEAARISSLLMLFLMLGKPFIGFLYEALGLKLASVLSTVFMLLGVVSALFIHSAFFIVTLIIGAGIGFAYSSIAYPAYARHLFGLKNFANFSAFLQITSGAGTLIGPIITSLTYYYTKSYNLYFYISLFYILLALAIWIFVLPKRGREPY